jgi:hypothetical protein
MKLTKLMFALLAVAGALIAADPMTGTWKLDPAKSKYKTGAGPKEQTVTITEAGANLDIVVKGTSADNKPISTHMTLPAGGGAGKIIEGPYDAVTGKRISATERETSYSKGGKVVYTTHAKVSADGKTLTVDSKGMNALGQSVEGSVTYSK